MPPRRQPPDVRRRAVLLAFATAGGLGTPPGASGPRQPPDAPPDAPREQEPRATVVVQSFRTAPADDGTVRATVVVANRGDTARSATVAAALTVDGETTTKTASREVPAGGTSQVVFAFDVSYEKFQRSGAFAPRLV
jgi:hypothetical protein